MTARYRARTSSQGHHLRRASTNPSAIRQLLGPGGSTRGEPAQNQPDAGRELSVGAGGSPFANAPRTGPAAPVIWAVIPCMGRLSFLRQTAPLLLAQAGARLCLVDYSCPDHAGDWLEHQFPREVAEHRIVVERVKNQTWFSKTRAHNAGARRALAEGANYLCFLDADTIVEPGFWEFLVQHAHPQRFFIAGKQPDGTDVPSMTGLLLVHGQAFDSVHGFDEHFQSWGGEDIELRLRLYMVAGQDFGLVPMELARPIPHDDSLRSQFYPIRNILASNRANMEHLRYRMQNVWVRHCGRDPAGAAELWYRPPPSALFAPRHSRLLTSEASSASTHRQALRRGGY